MPELLGPLFEIGPVDFCPLAPDHRRDVFEIAGPPSKQFVNHQSRGARPLLTVDQIAHSTLPSEETSCRRFGIDHLLS